MQLKTFTALTMQDALKIIKHDLGPDAVILSTRKIKGTNGKPSLEITAALDKNTQMVELQPTPIEVPKAPRKDQPSSSDLETILCKHGLPENHRNKLCTAVQGVSQAGFTPEDALDMVLGKSINFQAPASLVGRGHVHVFVGPTGAGKTTLVSKLAIDRKKSGATIGLMSLDDQKIAGFEPLRVVSDALKEQAYLLRETKDLLKAAKELGKRHYLFIDTPGLNPRKPKDIKAFKERLDGLGIPFTVHLVIPAHLNADDMAALPYAFREFEPTGIIFTKLDETTRIGSLTGLIMQHPIAVGMVCESPAVEEGPVTLNAQTLAHQLTQPPTPIWEEQA